MAKKNKTRKRDGPEEPAVMKAVTSEIEELVRRHFRLHTHFESNRLKTVKKIRGYRTDSTPYSPTVDFHVELAGDTITIAEYGSPFCARKFAIADGDAYRKVMTEILKTIKGRRPVK